MNQITKAHFDWASAVHKPNAFVTFMYKHFSTEAESMQLRGGVIMFLVATMMVGYIASFFTVSFEFMKVAVLTYCISLAIFVISLFVAVFMNQYRVRKIAKLLGVSLEDYNKLVFKFYPPKKDEQ